jgi:hypothetical protein
MDLSDPTTQQWMAVSGWIIGAVSLVIAIVTTILYLLDRKSKKPRWAVTTTPIIEDSVSKIPGLRITYLDRSIKSFLQTSVLFWNAGKEPIRRTDIAPGEPLRIAVASPDAPYSISKPATNNRASNPVLYESERFGPRCIAFDYLEQNHGIKFIIYHGDYGPDAIKVDGIVIGARLVKVNTDPLDPNSTMQRIENEVMTLFILIPVITVAFLVALAIYQFTDNFFILAIPSALVAIGGMLLARKYAHYMFPSPPSIVPKDLKLLGVDPDAASDKT